MNFQKRKKWNYLFFCKSNKQVHEAILSATASILSTGRQLKHCGPLYLQLLQQTSLYHLLHQYFYKATFKSSIIFRHFLLYLQYYWLVQVTAKQQLIKMWSTCLWFSSVRKYNSCFLSSYQSCNKTEKYFWSIYTLAAHETGHIRAGWEDSHTANNMTPSELCQLFRL